MTAPPPSRVPTLTEIVSLDPQGVDADLGPLVFRPLQPTPPPQPEARPAPDVALIIDDVLRDVQQRIDAVVEQRLREALAPALARAAERLIDEARERLVASLHEIVVQAVSSAIERRLRQPGDGEPR